MNDRNLDNVGFFELCSHNDCNEWVDGDTNDTLCLTHYRFKCWDLYLLKEELNKDFQREEQIKP
jgi:hypothetical protein